MRYCHEFDINTKLNFISLQGNPLLLQFLAKRFSPALQVTNSLIFSSSTSLPQQSGVGLDITAIQLPNSLQDAETRTPTLSNANGAQSLKQSMLPTSSAQQKSNLQATDTQRSFRPGRRAVQKRKFSEVEDDESCSEPEPPSTDQRICEGGDISYSQPEPSSTDQGDYEVEAILAHKRGESVSLFKHQNI